MPIRTTNTRKHPSYGMRFAPSEPPDGTVIVRPMTPEERARYDAPTKEEPMPEALDAAIIAEIRARHQRGESTKQIARALHHSPSTIARYVQEMPEAGQDAPKAPDGPSPDPRDAAPPAEPLADEWTVTGLHTAVARMQEAPDHEVAGSDAPMTITATTFERTDAGTFMVKGVSSAAHPLDALVQELIQARATAEARVHRETQARDAIARDLEAVQRVWRLLDLGPWPAPEIED